MPLLSLGSGAGEPSLPGSGLIAQKAEIFALQA